MVFYELLKKKKKQSKEVKMNLSVVYNQHQFPEFLLDEHDLTVF